MMRKHLNANAIYSTARSIFANIPEHRTNLKNIQISLPDALVWTGHLFNQESLSLAIR